VILVLRALGVGDLATAVPALRALRAACPGQELVLAAPRWLMPLVDLTGAVDLLVPVNDLGVHRWCGPSPALAVNLHGRGPQSHRVLAASRPDRLVAYANPAAGHVDGPPWTSDVHEVDRWCRLLAWYGIPADRDDLDLTVPPAPVMAGVTVLHPGAKSPARRWPASRFAQVARALAGAGHRVVITGSAGEQGLAARVAQDAGLSPSTVLAGRTGLRELAAVVAQARLVVSGDTGIAHLATAYRTPSVVLCGPVPPRLWGPPPQRPYHRAIWHGRRADPGDDPGPAPHPALLAITAEEVVDAAYEAERAAGPRARRYEAATG
jgi:ADP-heptose:LPS heptosyltransferase